MNEAAIRAILNARPRRVVFFTGAGVSADSGVPTFRGPGGLWRSHQPEELATPEAFRRDPKLVWEWYEWRRGLIREAKPNAAHQALARVTDAVVVTQNVDNLHRLAGSQDVIELHGNIFRVRCTREHRTHVRHEPFADVPPRCACGALLRPDVVWFGEQLPQDEVARAFDVMDAADLLVVIGTSGVVQPAASFVNYFKGDLSIEINPQASALTSSCTYAIAERAAVATPPLIDAILEARA
jgi:NAD-dependent deacetylase